MEKIITAKEAFRFAITENAKNGKVIGVGNSNLSKEEINLWKSHVSVLISCVSAYATALENTNGISAMDSADFLVLPSELLTKAIQEERNKVFRALKVIRDFAGFTFKTGNNEPELMVKKLISEKARKNEYGEIIAYDDFTGSETTARKKIEWYLYARQYNIIGKTAEETTAERKEKAEAKKAENRAKARAKREAEAEAKKTAIYTEEVEAMRKRMEEAEAKAKKAEEALERATVHSEKKTA